MPLFYLPEIENDSLTLTEEESHHALRVLRLKVGDGIELTDGKGLMCTAKIRDMGKKQVSVVIEDRQRIEREYGYKLHIAIAPTKNIERFEWFLEKATEIGIDEITPLITVNSERTRIRPERLEKVIVAAMKQSLKAYKPRLNEPSGFENFLKENRLDYQQFIAYCGNIEMNLFSKEYQKGLNSVILIGPEGDFSREEVHSALLRGYKAISFGRSRLRTETAGIVACHATYILNQ